MPNDGVLASGVRSASGRRAAQVDLPIIVEYCFPDASAPTYCVLIGNSSDSSRFCGVRLVTSVWTASAGDALPTTETQGRPVAPSV